MLKIEGRARGAEYVKRVVECYDLALRAIERGEYSREYAEGLKVTLSKVFNRGFWGGYYAGAKVVVATVTAGEVFVRTGINTDYGWSRVEYQGQTLYCISSYLNIAE